MIVIYIIILPFQPKPNLNSFRPEESFFFLFHNPRRPMFINGTDFIIFFQLKTLANIAGECIFILVGLY